MRYLFMLLVAVLAAAESPTVVVELEDGSRLIGRPEAEGVRVRMAFDVELSVPWTWVREAGRGRIILRNGDRLTASFTESAISLKTEFGEQAVPTAQIVQIRAWESALLDGLMVHYDFRQAGDAVRDIGPRRLDAAGNGVGWSPSRGGAATFDGTAHITFPDSIALANDAPKSVSLWFRLDGIKPWARFFMWYLGDKRLVLAAGANGRVLGGTLNANAARAQGGTQVGTGRWHHAVWTSNGIDLRIYLDGRSEALTPLKANWAADDPGIFGGARVGGGSNFCLHGALDDLMIFDRELSAREVVLLFEQQSAQN